jgi:hypothetical protein
MSDAKPCGPKEGLVIPAGAKRKAGTQWTGRPVPWVPDRPFGPSGMTFSLLVGAFDRLPTQRTL